MTVDGDRAAMLALPADDAGRPPARGQEYVLPGGAFFEVRDGRIARVTNYYNLEDWVAQVSKAD